jgi:hypothetical protein
VGGGGGSLSKKVQRIKVRKEDCEKWFEACLSFMMQSWWDTQAGKKGRTMSCRLVRKGPRGHESALRATHFALKVTIADVSRPPWELGPSCLIALAGPNAVAGICHSTGSQKPSESIRKTSKKMGENITSFFYETLMTSVKVSELSGITYNPH